MSTDLQAAPDPVSRRPTGPTKPTEPSEPTDRTRPADPIRPEATTRLLRIHEVAELVALTPRTIRYYEEVGLLEPAARSEGAYRLYDEDDLERLRYIKAMRDDAGFSLAELRTLLEDERARSRSRERYLATTDPAERREILVASAARLERQVSTLRAKRDRLDVMIADAEERRARVQRRIAELEAGGDGAPDGAAASGRPPSTRAGRGRSRGSRP